MLIVKSEPRVYEFQQSSRLRPISGNNINTRKSKPSRHITQEYIITKFSEPIQIMKAAYFQMTRIQVRRENNAIT